MHKVASTKAVKGQAGGWPGRNARIGDRGNTKPTVSSQTSTAHAIETLRDLPTHDNDEFPLDGTTVALKKR
jgi:hypothetical protein